jgi:anti-sigma regulatory factor (Ser/Thr protein kinase)
MIANGTDKMQDRLVLRSRLEEMAQLPVWIEGLTSRHAIPDKTQFAIDLCLEEALSNVIRHGYAGVEDRSVSVQFSMPRDSYFEFVIEDEAPHFNPLDAPALPALNATEEIRVGGQGIRFLREFSDALEYEPTPVGNRLRIGFSADDAAPSPNKLP